MTSSAIPGARTVYVRPNGRTGALMAYDVLTGERLFSLPGGVLSADGKTFISTVWGKKRSRFARFDPRSGRKLSGSWIRGSWNAAGVTSNGSRYALMHYWKRGVVLRVGRTEASLRGYYDLDALSPDGRRAYLVHRLDRGYKLQQLDLSTRKLTLTKLDDPSEKMSGTALNAVATRDGHWLLTLYGKSDMHSFVHALDLRSGVAHCIDLPLIGDFMTLGSTAMTLSPDETTLYLAAPYIGRAASVDLMKLEVGRVTRFGGLSPYNLNMVVGPSGAVTPNGRMLAFSGQRTVWLYDTAFGAVRQVFHDETPVTGLGFTPDGKRLLVLQRHGRAAFLDAATGDPVG
jgi:hypothetical protein